MAARVLVGLSGGVDSAVSAYLAQQQGFAVHGLYLQMLPGSAAEADWQGAQRVAKHLQIPLHFQDCCAAFDEDIVLPFCTAYNAGRTPNPCIRCNLRIKFALLNRWRQYLDCASMVTGHYARVQRQGDLFKVLRGRDRQKDQSYFLFPLGQAMLAHLWLPLGDMDKSQVRRLAHHSHMPVARRSESQDICFVPDDNYAQVVAARQPEQIVPGPIRHISGRVLGEHGGIYRFTIGQRRGLGLSWSEPLYVVALEASSATLWVGERPCLYQQTAQVADVCFPWGAPAPGRLVSCQLRYQQRPLPVRLWPLGQQRWRLRFRQPQAGVTPGQAAVFYQGQTVLGGGWLL